MVQLLVSVCSIVISGATLLAVYSRKNTANRTFLVSRKIDGLEIEQVE